ncbi:MAG: anthranilate phosphoribosyltransferase [Alphaproteobacteria bacterium]
MSAREETARLVGALLDGALDEAEALRTLEALDDANLTPAQLAGGVDAVMARTVPFPAFPEAIDCCGTGGDGKQTLNISTAAALVVAGAGVAVAKHGNRAVTSQSGSADVLDALGVATQLSPERAAGVLEQVGICFLFAPNFHPGFARIAPLRKRLGKRTIFNLLGPLCNPAQVKRQLIGVFAAERCALVAETARLIGRERVMVVHGEGSDEIAISGTTQVCELREGIVIPYVIDPADGGVERHAAAGLAGGDAKFNAKALRDVLDGESSTYADAVQLNAAAALFLAGRAQDLGHGAALAQEVIASGAAHAKLGELIEASHG